MEIKSYLDLLGKLEYDLDRYSKNNHIYELLDCLLTLNALPEWIVKSSDINKSLKERVTAKIAIMKGNDFDFDESKLHSDIDHQLRSIRLICNHSKHKTDSKSLPTIRSKYGATFPFKFPGKFHNIVAIGNIEIDAEILIKNVTNFWKSEIRK